MSIERINTISATIETEFAGLNNVQLNWKPGEKRWSIAQLLEHLIVHNRKYFEALRKVLSEKYKPTFWEKFNPLTSYTGRNLILNMGPAETKKYVSPLLFTPSKKMISQDIVTYFNKMQEEFVELYMKFEGSVLKDRVITSPLANLITLKAGDVLEFLIGHEERHLEQALRVKHSSGFPL